MKPLILLIGSRPVRGTECDAQVLSPEPLPPEVSADLAVAVAAQTRHTMVDQESTDDQ